MHTYTHIQRRSNSGPFHDTFFRMMSSNSIVAVTVAWSVPAAVQTGMQQHYIQQLRECQDYNECFHYLQPPHSLPSYVYLIACKHAFQLSMTPFNHHILSLIYLMWNQKGYMKARLVTDHATREYDLSATRLSFLHALRWLPPMNFDTILRKKSWYGKLQEELCWSIPSKTFNKKG